MSKVHNLSRTSSMMHQYLHDLRNVEQHGSRVLFRENLKRVGRALGWEISKHLDYESRQIETPLESTHQKVLINQIVSITILRAGLPLHDGILDVFPEAENGFISAYRKHDSQGGFEIEVEYVACPELTGKTVILNDPMIATGQSVINAWSALKDLGEPENVHIVSVIGSEEGVQYVRDNALGACNIWVGAIDPHLNQLKYIVPGLGDAGDLAFGIKNQH